MIDSTDALHSAVPGLGQLAVIGILRGCPPDLTRDVAATAADKGLRVIEVTLDSAEPLRQIEEIGKLGGLSVGVGSVLDPEDARRAIDVGAQFVVCPTVDARVIEQCADLGVSCIPGAATPTEIMTALRAGAIAVKVFPAAQLGGPGFLSSVRAPLGHPPLVPTGGISAGDAPAYLAAGATAIGAGGTLFPPAALDLAQLDVIADLTTLWVTSMT